MLSTTDHLATVAEEIEQVDLEIAAEQETLEDEEVNSSGSDLQFSDSENHMRFNSTDNSKLDSMISPFKSSRAHNRHNSTDNSKLESMISPFKSSRARPYDDSDMSSLNYSQNSARAAGLSRRMAGTKAGISRLETVLAEKEAHIEELKLQIEFKGTEISTFQKATVDLSMHRGKAAKQGSLISKARKKEKALESRLREQAATIESDRKAMARLH